MTSTNPNTTAMAFKLTPYGEVLDLSNDKDTKLFKSACDAFETTFDGELKNVTSFIDKVKNRAKHIQCYGIFNVTTPLGGTLSLFDKWSTISKGEVRAAAATRWGTDNWEKQASYIMGKAILDSLSEDFRARVIQFQQEYEIAQGGSTYNDGPCVLKRIIDLVFIQMDDEGFTIRDEIINMKLSDHGDNVIEYNSTIKDLVRHLESTPEGMSEQAIKHNLIMAYKEARNDEFTRFVEQIMNSGALPPIVELMSRAEKKYKQLVNSGTWNAISKDEQILALKIETKKLRKELKKKPKKQSKKLPARKEKHSKHGRKDDDRFSWMYKEPQKGEKKVTKRNGKEWAWCKYHKKWVVKHTDKFGEHTSETCLLNPKNKNKKGREKLAVEIAANVAEQADSEGVPTDSDASMDISVEEDSSEDES